MRLPVVLALGAPPLALALGVTACGGPAFTSAPGVAGSLTPDAGGDGAGGLPGSFCAVEAGTHTFCDDFDGPPLAAKWDGVDQGTGGTAVTDLTVSDSPPGSFKSVAPASVGTQTRGRLIKSFRTASRVVLDFAMSLDATPARLGSGVVGGDNLVAIAVGPGYSIGLSAHTDQVSYFEDATGDGGASQLASSKDLVATPTLAPWTPVEIAIDLAHASLSVTIGGVVRLDGAPITPPSGQNITVYLGAFSHNQNQNFAVHYDNATIDITP